MSNYQNTKATIAANVYTNHNNEVTAAMVKAGINAVVDTLIAGGFLYKGVATTSTNPGSPDANVFYIATAPGTYTNFGSLVVADGEVAILKYNGSWSKEVTGAATAAEVSALGHKVYDLEFNVGYENTQPEENEISILDDADNEVAKINENGVFLRSADGLPDPSVTSEEEVIFGEEDDPVMKVTPLGVQFKKILSDDGFSLDFSDRETAAALRDYIAALDLSTMPIPGNIVVLGDSTVAGYLSGVRVSSLLSVTGTKNDVSAAGATIGDMQTAWDNLAAATKTAANFVFVEVGLNSLASSPLDDYQTLVASIREDSPSAKVIICTMSPAHQRFYDSSTPSVAAEKYANWVYLNTAIRNILFWGANAAAWFHSLVMADGEDNLLPQYEYSTPDHIHPNAAGVKVIAWSWLMSIYK